MQSKGQWLQHKAKDVPFGVRWYQCKTETATAGYMDETWSTDMTLGKPTAGSRRGNKDEC